MKKITTLLLIIFSFSLLLTSCDSFLVGSELKKELEELVEYNKAEKYRIRVQADEGTGTIIVGAGDNEIKVTDSFNISFQKSREYKFIKWTAVKKSDESVSAEEFIVFGDNKKAETSVTLLKEPDSEIIVKPICEKVLSVTKKTPVYEDNGVARDSTITFVFSEPLSAENDLSKIELSIMGALVEENTYFKAPEIYENNLIIAANLENRIYVNEGNVKTVSVKIPGDFKYTTKSGDLEIGDDITHTYLINSSTTDKTAVLFVNENENGGVLKVEGSAASSIPVEYSIGQKVSVKYSLADGYKFNGWDCSDTDSLLLIYPDEDIYDENGFDKSSSIATLTFQIIKQSDDVTLTAKVEKIPTRDIVISSSVGRITPNGTLSDFLLGNSSSLDLSIPDEYQFMGWQVYDVKTGSDLSEKGYITIADKNDVNTEFSLVAVPESDDVSLGIQPVCVIRPQVLSKLPAYTSGGTYRDAKIQVSFDQKISQDSIYFTADEIETIKAEGGVFLNPYVSEDTSEHYYGYKKDNSIFYKNITIINNNTKENLLKNFGAPYFDATSTLIIPAKTGIEAPAPGILITVELSNKIFYVSEERQVYMLNNERWNYLVNNFIDSVGPVFDDIIVTGSNSEQLTATDYFPLSQESIKAAYLDDNKFSAFIKISDEGSGPQNLVVTKKRIYDGSYSEITEVETVLSTNQLDVMGNSGYFGVLDSVTSVYSPMVFDLSEDEDGIYEIKFSAIDKNGNSRSLKYYVVKDTSSLVVTKINVISGTNSVTFGWKNSIDIDPSSLIVKKDEESITLDNSVKNINTSVSFVDSGLALGKSYTYSILAKDIFGHEFSYETTIATKPKKVTASKVSISSVRETGSTINYYRISWDTNENEQYSGVYFYISPNDDEVDFSPLKSYKVSGRIADFVANSSTATNYITTEVTKDSYFKLYTYNNGADGFNIQATRDSYNNLLIAGKKYYFYFMTYYVNGETELTSDVIKVSKNTRFTIPDITYDYNFNHHDPRIQIYYENVNSNHQSVKPFETISKIEMGTITQTANGGNMNRTFNLEAEQTAPNCIIYETGTDYGKKITKYFNITDDEGTVEESDAYTFITPFTQVEPSHFDTPSFNTSTNNLTLSWGKCTDNTETLKAYKIIIYVYDTDKWSYVQKAEFSCGTNKSITVENLSNYITTVDYLGINNTVYFNIYKINTDDKVSKPYSYKMLKIVKDSNTTISIVGWDDYY